VPFVTSTAPLDLAGGRRPFLLDFLCPGFMMAIARHDERCRLAVSLLLPVARSNVSRIAALIFPLQMDRDFV
jgi:hypothetical protein